MESAPLDLSDLIDRLRKEIILSASNLTFPHHEWYVEYHLLLVERIAQELLTYYPEADRDLVDALVWTHDYGKMITRVDDRQATVTQGRKKLLELGFPPPFVDRVVEFVKLMDRSQELDLRKCSIEVQIVSSADGCSHLIGPFFYMWFREHPDVSLVKLMADNRRKAIKDWDRKIVLPEARAAFLARHHFIMEQNGELPDKFLSEGWFEQ
jgi:hypothetical protein